MMPTVWVAKRAGHKLDGAALYGEVVEVFEESFSPFQLNLGAVKLKEALDARPPSSGDYMLFSGPNSLNCLLFRALLKELKVLKLLIYHARERKYVEREVAA